VTQKVFITGANRGIGLALARKFVVNGDQVFATARKPDDAVELKALRSAGLTILKLDVADKDSIASSVAALSVHTDSLDVLINNAGVNPKGAQSFDQIEAETMMETFRVNIVAPLMVVKGFVDFLKNGTNPRIVNISSQMGSMAWQTHGGAYAYSPSKSGLNMVTRSLAADLKPFGITSVMMHPGWVQTDMGGANASLTIEESAEGIFAVVAGLSEADNGAFYDWNGDSRPW